MFIHLDDMAKAVKRHVGGHETRDSTGSDYVLDYINRSWEIVYGTILSLEDGFFTTYYDLSLSGSREYDLPIGVSRVFSVEDITGGSTNPVDTDPINYEQRFLFHYSALNTLRYYIKDRKIGIPSKKTSGVLRIWIPHRPTELFAAKPSAVSGTSISFAIAANFIYGSLVPSDDYYNGMFLMSSDGQVREAADFVGSTKTFTVGSTWDTDPTVNTTSVSLVAPIGSYQSLISIGAGILWRLDLDLPVGDLEKQYEKIEKPLIQLLSKNQTHRTKQVKKIYR